MKILIAEDDQAIAELVRDYLLIDGFECDIAADGVTGLNKAIENDYALVVLDLMLPEMDGFTLLSKLRNHKETPVIILSAKREEADKVRGLGLGADDYMVKPFSPGELAARVKTHIARYDRLTGGTARNRDILKIRGLEIDRAARKVSINGTDRQFTAREFDLLLFLADSPNRVFSRDVLFDRVWGLDAFGDVATVTVHIQRIREKIEADTQNPQYIETVWGAGYRFRL